MEDKKSTQLSYYYKHREERSAYARAYYAKRKLAGVDKKPRKRYKTWRSNNESIQDHKKYLEENDIKIVTLSFR